MTDLTVAPNHGPHSVAAGERSSGKLRRRETAACAFLSGIINYLTGVNHVFPTSSVLCEVGFDPENIRVEIAKRVTRAAGRREFRKAMRKGSDECDNENAALQSALCNRRTGPGLRRSCSESMNYAARDHVFDG
jgi:hypothetical protein